MNVIYASHYGNPWFNIVICGRPRMIYKITWFQEMTDDVYTMCFYYWLPEHKRETQRCGGLWGNYKENQINRILRVLMESGKFDLDGLV